MSDIALLYHLVNVMSFFNAPTGRFSKRDLEALIVREDDVWVRGCLYLAIERFKVAGTVYVELERSRLIADLMEW